MAKSIPGGVEIVNTLSTKNDGNYPLVKAESVGMADGTTAEDNIKKKLDKNQGTQNNGKFMRVGADGNLVPDDVPIPDVSGQIKEHNENTDSHQDIRTELKKKANSGTTLSDYGITDAVPDSHLTDSKAHEDIRKETAKLKEDIVGLDNRKADAIVETASGTPLDITDSAKLPIQDLRIFGKSEQNGVPSLDAPIPIVNVGEKGNVDIKINTGNLFDINTVKKYEVDNTTLSLSVSGNKIIFNSKISTGKEAIMNVLGKNNDAIKLPLGKYILSYKSNKPFGSTNGTDTVEMHACIRTGDSTVYRATGTKNYVIFEIKEGDELFLRFDINKSGQSAEFYDIMLNHGESVLPYELYFNQSLTLSTPNGLPGLKVDKDGNYTDSTGQQWICDEIDLARGKYIQRIGKYIFIGSEPVSEQTNRDGYIIPIAKLDDNILENKSYLSNRFIFSKKAWVNDGEFGLQAGVMFITDKNFAHFNSPDGLKTFLKDNETYIIYPLIRPIETDLPQETITVFKTLHTNYPTTVISNDENAGMEAAYVADTKHYIDKKFEELNQAIVNTQIALL